MFSGWEKVIVKVKCKGYCVRLLIIRIGVEWMVEKLTEAMDT